MEGLSKKEKRLMDKNVVITGWGGSIRRLKGNGKNTTEKVFKEFFICIISRSSKYLKVLLVPICILLINIFAHESLHV